MNCERRCLKVKNKKRKGISPFLSHSIIVAFSAFLIFVVISTMTSITNEYRSYFSDNEINQFCFTIRSGIEKIYSTQAYLSQTNTTYGDIIIDLPEKITDMNYRARFSGSNLTITAVNGQKTVTCFTGYDINFTGSTTGGLTRIIYRYYSNGTRAIEMSKL